MCTGALSNAALLLMLFPEVAPMVEITLMGGCLGVGNTHPVAEFNIVVRVPTYWLPRPTSGRAVRMRRQSLIATLYVACCTGPSMAQSADW